MTVSKSVSIILILKPYLIKKSLSELIIEEFDNIQVINDIENFDKLLTLAEKAVPCCIIADSSTIRKFGQYLHKLPSNSTVVPVVESTKEIEKFYQYKNTISIGDDRRQIVELIHRAIGSIPEDVVGNTQISELTSRETIILQFISKGLSSKTIAEKLNISIQTVSTHRKNISAKLGIKSVSGLTLYAIINNLINTDETNII